MAQAPVTGLPIADKPGRYTCVNCKIQLDSTEAQRAHFKTEWHLYNLKRKVCKLEPIDTESFNKIHELAPKTVQLVNDNKSRMKQHSISIAQTVSEKASTTNVDDDDEGEENWEEVDDEELIDQDYDEEDVAELLARVVPQTTCLFCTKTSQDIKSNVTHMELFHGFFIPEEQYLIDIEGLMEYLGFKVGAGATCLWCSKQFTTLQGVRLHMLYKDHCKIRYDQEKAIDEFKDFYDYATQEQIPMKPLIELAIPKKRSEKHTDYQRALMLKQKSSSQSKQLIARKNPAIVAGTYQSKNIKKFNAQRAKRLLHIGMTNNQAVRGRLRRQNPM